MVSPVMFFYVFHIHSCPYLSKNKIGEVIVLLDFLFFGEPFTFDEGLLNLYIVVENDDIGILSFLQCSFTV